MERKQIVDTLMIAIGAALADTHTATIAKVTGVSAKTINCRPVINRVVRGGSIPLPEFVDVPPLFMSGGTSYTAHPIAVGDYCLLIFTERCFDRWYHGQDYQAPLEMRMHDYSDAIAIVGLKPLAGALTIPSVIQQTGDTNQDGDYTHTGSITRTGNTELTGDLTQTGNQNVTGILTLIGNQNVTGNIAAVSFSGPAGGTMTSSSRIDATGFDVSGAAGVSGTFTTSDGKTVTVTQGIITSIV